MSNASDLSAATEDYLKYIWSATEWSNTPVTTSRLAREMGLSPSTVSESIAKLTKDGLVEHEKYRSIRLSPDGKRHALAMVRAHRLIETFLHDELGYTWDEVHDEAEDLEHAVSIRFIDAIDELLGYPDYDPHGDPIPSKDGILPEVLAILVAEAPTGEARVHRIADSDPEALRLASELGLRPGETIIIAEGTLTVGGKETPLDPFASILWVTHDHSRVTDDSDRVAHDNHHKAKSEGTGS